MKMPRMTVNWIRLLSSKSRCAAWAAIICAVLCLLCEAQRASAQTSTPTPTATQTPTPIGESSIAIVEPPLSPAVGGGSSSDDPITLGPDTRVNDSAATQNRPQVEPSVANDLTPGLSSYRLVASYADYQDDPEDILIAPAPSVSLSSDGGRSWRAPAGGVLLPPPEGFTWGSGELADYLYGGDNSVAWGQVTTDRVYVAAIGLQNHKSGLNIPDGLCDKGGIYVYRSDDAGENWYLPTDDDAPAVANEDQVFQDKPYIAVDADPLNESGHPGNIYLVWTEWTYLDCPQANGTPRIQFSVSEDGGETWSAAQRLDTGSGVNVHFGQPAVAVNGDVYVSWLQNGFIYVSRSTDGGDTFEDEVAAQQVISGSPGPANLFRFGNIPSIATDAFDSEKVYLTWSAGGAGSNNDVFFSGSNDSGETWSSPLRVNDDTTGDTNRDQFFPWISVTPSGTVQVIWADDRLDSTNGVLYHIFMAQSRNEGSSFSANFRLTSYPSDPNWDGFPDAAFIGDYFGLSSTGVAVWDDERSEAINQDIYGSPRCHLDVDVTHSTQALTDGLLCQRFLLGFTGSSLISGVVGAGAQRSTAAEIVAYLDGCKDNALTASMLDVDGNGTNGGLTDGTLILRYLFGFTGSLLIQDAVGAGCTRCTATAIEAFLALFKYLP